MPAHTERDFETAIEAGLIGAGGYQRRAPGDYDEACALFPADVIGFLKDSQPTRWGQLATLLRDRTETTVLDALVKELEIKGTLHVLRHGIKCHGNTLRLTYFKPNSGLNPASVALHAWNRLTITRQVAFASAMKHADSRNRRCVIDETLTVNGLPVVTAELKNPFTGQRGRCHRAI